MRQFVGSLVVTNTPQIELAITKDPHLGPEIAAAIQQLRTRRNAVAHGPHETVSREQAITYAESAFELIGIFGKLPHFRT